MDAAFVARTKKRGESEPFCRHGTCVPKLSQASFALEVPLSKSRSPLSAATVPSIAVASRTLLSPGRTSSLRWLIFASLGYAATNACGGRSYSEEWDGSNSRGDADNFGGKGSATGVGGSRSDTSRAGSTGRAGSGREVGGATGVSPAGSAGTASAGSAGSSGTASYAGSSGVGGIWSVVPGPCEYPEALGNGFERCETGLVRRPSRRSAGCSSELPRAQAFDAAAFAQLQQTVIDRGLTVEQTLALLPCYDDNDCVAGPNGYCTAAAGFTDNITQCNYGCTVDADCGGSAICECASPVGQCVPTSCFSDADCGHELLSCTPFQSYPGCAPFAGTAFGCQTPWDECLVDADCPENLPFCVPDGERRACSPGNGCPPIGRPFMVGSELRLAERTERSDWLGDGELSLAPVHPALEAEPELRGLLGAAWTELGLMEHASVASFARFALGLASLGAPPELLSAAAGAMQDETRHAQACFALASRYLGERVGPGGLDVTHALGALRLEDIVLDAVREGCIGETAAALEASAAAEHCVDASTRAALEQIAKEEAQHAELAWRFVAWALSRAPASLLERVHTVFLHALQESLQGQLPRARFDDPRLLAFGIVSAQQRQEIRRRALLEAIIPCSVVLLAEARSHAELEPLATRSAPA